VKGNWLTKAAAKAAIRSFREGDTPMCAPDHSAASHKSAFANDRSQSGEGIVHALTATAREMNQLVADIGRLLDLGKHSI
jgi:hypothetical protein